MQQMAKVICSEFLEFLK